MGVVCLTMTPPHQIHGALKVYEDENDVNQIQHLLRSPYLIRTEHQREIVQTFLSSLWERNEQTEW